MDVQSAAEVEGLGETHILSNVVSKISRDAAAREAIRNLVSVKRAESPVFQIASRIRQMIHDAKLQPGTKLPTNQMLSAELQVDASAVQRALAQLVKEGLLVRTRRVGTFIAEPPKKKLERLAFYYQAEEGKFNEFGRALLAEITDLGHKQGFAVEVFGDTRKLALSEERPPDDLSRHARTRWVQGLVAPGVPPERVRWMESIPIPFATLSSNSYPHSLNWDRREMARAAIRQLVARGCKKIGVVTCLLAHDHPDADSYQLGLWRGLKEALEEAGLEICPERLIGIDSPQTDLQRDHASTGYEFCDHLWRNLPPDKRPDGLFIYPDSMAVGAILALSMHSVRIPEDLHIVLHTNAEFPVFCPFPADRLVVRVKDAAAALVGHIRDQLAGRTTPDRTLPVYLEPYG